VTVEFPPPSATAEVTFGANSRRGPARAVNDDHYLVVRMGRHQETLLTSLPADAIAPPFDEYGYAMVVADGMGGPTGGSGEAASRLAMLTLVHLMRHFGKWQLRVDDVIARDIMDRAEGFYRHIDAVVRGLHSQEPLRTEMTTLTATFSAGRDLFFAHVGHSRAYLLRDGQLLRLTRDHTLGSRRVSTVRMAPLIDINETARDLMHILTNTLGMSSSRGPLIDLERFQAVDNDRILVCTNGLTDIVPESEIADILVTAASPDDQSRTLVDRALELGGADDVTALVARYRFPYR
jgi:serine/threonine protein phosphatase PrpC